MAGDNRILPDTGGRSTSYADRAKLNIRFSQNLKRNVLEIEVVKESNEDEMILSKETIAKLLGKIRLNIHSHVEGYQVSYGRKKAKIEVLCKAGLDLEQFCLHESLQVERGVKTNFIRPAGRKDVEVTVTGLGFNTPDSLVQEYISKFGGKMVTNDVIYGKFGTGPFQGKLNGVRKYQVDFTDITTPMGTFHLLNGSKVKVFFRGNRSTCGWCHADITECPGGAKAKACKEKNTEQVHLGDHMRTLWDKINFDPQTFEVTELEYDDLERSDNIGGDRKVLNTAHFPRQVDRPKVSESDKEKFNVVRIRNFPLDISDEDIVKFLNEEVDEGISDKDVKSEKTDYSTNILLGPGPGLNVIAKAAEILDYKITSRTFFEEKRKLHVQLHRPLTPLKKEKANVSEKQEETDNSIDEETVIKSRSISEIQKDTVKITVTHIQGSQPAVPKLSDTLKKKKAGSNINVSSALTPSVARHKEHFK